MKSSQRLSSTPPYPFARWTGYVDSLRQAGIDVIRLDIGSPDLPPPDAVVEALCQSAWDPHHHGYPGYRGIPRLREAVTAYYAQRFGVSLDLHNQVVPLLGSKEGIVNFALAWLDPGDLVLIPDPGYAPYAVGACLAGAEIHTVPLLPECGFLPDLDAIPTAIAKRAKLIWLNYPNNPTGATASLEFFEQAVDMATRYNWLICHDAPYCDVTYDGYVAPSLLQVPGASEVALEFNSLSKTWNMAGWRIGMAVGNATALASLAKIKGNIDSGIFRPLQEAAICALCVPQEWIAERNQIYRDRISILVEALQAAGLQVSTPNATLYIWAKLTDAIARSDVQTSEAFALKLLNKTGVAVAPGSFFGPAGEGYVRVSVTASTDKIRAAAEHIRALAKSA